jgi:chitin disaccharide deacetylase
MKSGIRLSLGHTDDAKLLLIHADDLGMCHSVNAAIFEAFEQGAITSASMMAPCPGFAEAAEYARGHSHIDIGMHLTITSEWSHSKWGPVRADHGYSGLTNSLGHFWTTADDLISHGCDNVEEELSAQMNSAVGAGIRPTHIDAHMFTLFRTPGLFRDYLSISERFDVPCLLPAWLTTSSLHQDWYHSTTVFVPDNLIQAGKKVPASGWMDYYLNLLQCLKPGITVLIVHPGYDTNELREITQGSAAWGSEWRQRDFDVLTSREFRSALANNNIRLTTWRKIGEALKA